MMLSRIHGSGIPKNFERVMTPKRMEMAGATVKTAVETMVRFRTFLSIPTATPRLYARIKKNTDWAMTNKITTAASVYKKVLFGLKFIALKFLLLYVFFL
jgi:hypothetical protein